VHPQIYRLKIYVPGKGNRYLYFDLSGLIYYGKTLGETHSAENRFVQRANKYLADSRIEKVELVNFDRILRFRFSGEADLIFECMPRGNLVLVSKEGKILAAAMEAALRDRKIIPGEQYMPPPKQLDTPKKYSRLGLSKQILEQILRRDRCYLYYVQEQLVDILPFKINDLHPSAVIEEVAAPLPEVLFSFTGKLLFEKIQEFQASIKQSQLTKQTKLLEHLKRNLEQLEKKKEEIEKAIEFIENNYDKLEQLIEILRKKLDEGEAAAQEFLRQISGGKARLVREKDGLKLEIEK